MNSVLIFSNISLIFLIFIASSLPFYFSKKNKISIIDIGIGFLILITIAYLLYWTNFNKDLCAIFSMLFLATFTILSIKKSKNFLFSIDSAKFIFTYFFLLIFYSIGNTFRYKQYVNPDPMGYAAVTASLNEHGSFPNVFKNWALQTGQSFNFSFDWNAPLPLVPSAWGLPNEAVKYAADVIYFQRTGINSFISLFGHKFDTYAFYPYIWNSIGVFAVTLIIILVFNVNSHLLNSIANKSHTGSSKLKTKYLFLFTTKNSLYIFILFIFLSSIGIQVFLMEGFIPHLVSFMIIVLFGSVLLDVKSEFDNKFKIYAVVLLFVSIHIVYLQMLLVLYAILGFYLFYYLLKNWKNIKIISYIKTAFIAIPIAFMEYKLPGVNYLLKQIGESSGHGSVHLGTFNLNDVFGLFSKKIVLGTPTPGQNSVLYTDAKIQISTQQWGYLPISNSLLTVVFIYLLFLALCLYSLYKFKSNWKLLSLISTAIFLIITNLYYIISHTYFATSSRYISDYVWLRLNMVLVIILYIFIPAIIFYVIKKFNSLVVNSVLVISLLIGCFNAVVSVKSYSDFNNDFTISKKCPDFLSEDMIKKIAIAKDNSTMYNTPLSLFLCDSKVKSLSDPYATKQKLSKGTSVYVFTY